ncbi:four-carbon acid sugar kinase family protein [Planococcus ruber]|uniref:four-carbon acid sugar kinase family protein n=1 Tax=Planococcus ruber TaxID=2027871 RepID=UPI001FEF2947|nr:four-carbon acid sugar kinase family protein [Planococcus ruber]MCJ1908409.1 four-carbon acid sugar kinase family protein [Planococcus ruber]
MATQIGIIADDFTGANDSGVRLAQKGLKSRVILAKRKNENTQADQEIDVWIVDTNSRAMEEKEAYETVLKEIGQLKARGVSHFYKKVDSTLRGSVSAELKAMQEAAKMDVIFIAPAFPSMGRTVENGTLYVNGIPVADTEFGRDPKTPVRHSYIPDLLALDGISIAVLNREMLQGDHPEKWVLGQVEKGVQWIVCDVKEDADFALLANIEKNLNLNLGWAGSAGMINHLYNELGDEKQFKRVLQMPIDKVLVASGSLSARTQEQIEVLKERPRTKMIEIDPVMLLENPLEPVAMLQSLKQEDGWDSAVIYVGAHQENRDKVKEWATVHNRSAHQTAKGISNGLGLLVQEAMELSAFNALVMTGGDTAKDICNVLGIYDMELRFEVEAGLPLGLANRNGSEMIVVTKAGGFGVAESLANTVDYLKGAGSDANN